MPPPTKRHWARRLLRVLAWLGVLCVVAIAAAWFFGGPMVERLLREKLQTLVAQQLNARLEIGRLRYRWPYGVQVNDAALFSTTPGQPSIKLVGFDQLNLQLARLPFRKGPLVIERVDVAKPTLYVVETKQDGFIGLEHLFREPADKNKDNEKPPKLSDVLRLRHVQLTDARIEYDDRTIRKSVPFVWDKLGLTLGAEPQSGGVIHHFQVGAGNGDTARIDANGTVDLDALVLTLDSLGLTARMAAGQPNSPLPAGVQRVLNTLGVAGSGRATITGSVPFLHTRDMKLSGDFVIDDAQGRLSPEGRPLSDLDITGTIGLHGRDVTVDVNRFTCRRGPAFVSILPVTVKYALKTDRWSTTTIHAALAYAPPPDATGPLQQRATITLTAELTELKARDEFRVNVDGTRIALPDTAGDLTVAGVVRYDDEGITIEGLRLGGLGGPVTIAGFLNDEASAVAGEVNLNGVDLAKLNRIADPAGTRTLTGKLDGNLKGAVTETFDAVRGEGRFRVTGGTFAKVPILGGIADTLHVGQNAFTAHEASGRFTMEPGRLVFSRMAVNTDVLSVRGTGDVWYDGALNLSLYADGHWRDKPKADGFYIPVLSDIGRALAKTGQYAFGSVTRQFTHFTVTGTVDQVKVTPSPAPVLTEALERTLRGD